MRSIDNKTTDNPYGMDKDDLPINEKTIGDLRQAFLSIFYHAGLLPNELPELVNDNQIITALDSLYGHGYGKIIKVYGRTSKANLLLLDGAELDLSDKKYANLLQHLYDNPHLLINKYGVGADAEFYKFKIDIKANKLYAPDYRGKNAAAIFTDKMQANTMISSGMVKEHKHLVSGLKIQLNNASFNFSHNFSHSHNNNMQLYGYIDSYSFDRVYGINNVVSGSLEKINPAAQIGSEIALNRSNLITGAFYFIKSASSLEYPYNNIRNVHYYSRGYGKNPIYGLEFNASWGKSGGVNATNININSVPLKLTFDSKNISIDKNTNDKNNKPAGGVINWYMKI